MHHSHFRILRPILWAVLVLLIAGPGAARPAPEGERRGLRFGPQVETESFGAALAAPQTAETAARPAAPTAPDATLPMSKVYFQSIRNGVDFNIYAANPDSSELSLVINDPASDIQPRLARGGGKLAFVSDRSGVAHIYAANSDGSGLKMLTSGAAANQKPAWSPDGTLIAYQSYSDGQWEVYRMNADGTNKTRLTITPGGYSGEPSWSPDGSKIAYTSYQNGGWRIWVMNADGSGQTQLSQQPYSENPAWSPNGSQIAYNCVPNSDSIQWICVMNADGSDQQMSINSNGIYQDSILNGWSPDNTWLVYTRVNYTVENGTWYWTDASIYFFNNRWDYFSGNTINYDMNADWQTLDAVKPQIIPNSLPAVSPARFELSWQTSDPGGSGVRRAYIQVRDGINGDWVDWQNRFDGSNTYTGIGGHTYYFRVRVVDNGLNYSAWTADDAMVTSVENQPPVSSLQILPEYSPYNFIVTWNGTDPGGSGIDHYLIEYKDGLNGSWGMWLNYFNVASSYEFKGQPGRTYYFRISAVDLAQNSEGYHAPDGYDTFTTTYSFLLSGSVIDHMGHPLRGVAVNTQPAGMFPGVFSDAGGSFTAPIAAGGPVTATWSKPGYGQPLANKYTYTNFAQVNQLMVMPPSDNLVVNPGMEFTQAISAPWATGGVNIAFPDPAHLSGDSSIRFGAKNIFDFVPFAPAGHTASQMVVDSLGVTHLVWLSGTPTAVYYRQKPAGGEWSQPQQIPTNAAPLNSWLTANIGPEGSLYLSWRSAGGISRIRRSSAGKWSLTFTFPYQDYHTTYTSFEGDSAGVGYFAWVQDHINIMYTQVSSDGKWLEPIIVASTTNPEISYIHLAVDTHNNVHLLWINFGTYEYNYIYRSPEGLWSSPTVLLQVSESCNNSAMLLSDDQGGLYAFFTLNEMCGASEHPNSLMLRYRSPAGVWGGEEGILPRPIESDPHVIRIGSDGSIHIMYRNIKSDGLGNVKYISRSPEGVWSGIETLNDTFNLSNAYYMQVDSANNVHLIWNETPPYGVTRSFYAKRTASGWHKYGLLTTTDPSVNPVIQSLAVAKENRVWASSFFTNPETNTGGLQIGLLSIPQQDGVIYLQQTAALPAEMPNPVLSYVYQLQAASAQNGARFDVLINQAGVTTTLFTTSESTAGWAHQWFDLSSYSGQPARLTFQMFFKQDTLGPLTLLDDVTIGSSPGDLWVSNARGAALPGSQVVYSLNFGNLGGVPAQGVVVSHTLPAGLTFVSASLPFTPTLPLTGTLQTLMWNLGSLPGRTQRTITITATVSAEVSLGATLLGQLGISSLDFEPETGNNSIQTRMFIGRQFFLPVLKSQTLFAQIDQGKD